jgi:periplasmic divalent cation tolerance protein
MTEKYILVMCTCPDDVAAAKIATAVVTERLAACVNRIPRVVATFWWKDQVQTDTEALLLIKTVDRLLEPLMKRIHDLHPYEVPEVIKLPIEGGSELYLAWIGRSVAQ